MDNMDTFPMGNYSLMRREAPPTNELSGIWFLELVDGTPIVGLDLPDLSGTALFLQAQIHAPHQDRRDTGPRIH